VSASAEIAVEAAGSAVVAHVAGEIDITTVQRLACDLLETLGNDATTLVVDLTGVRYVDSAGIEMLFETSRRLRRRRQGMALVVPPGSLLSPVFDLTGIDAAAPMFTTVEAALQER